MTYENTNRRALAFLVDGLIAYVVFVIVAQRLLFVPVRHLIFGADDWLRLGWNSELYTLLTISLPTWLYFALFERSSWQATPGKRLLKLKTLDQASGGRIGWLQATLRTLIKLMPWEIAHLTNSLPTPLWYDPDPGFRIGFLVAPLLIIIFVVVVAVTRKRQGLHDLVAKTVVVRKV